MQTEIFLNRTTSTDSRKAEWCRTKLDGKSFLKLKVEFRPCLPQTGEQIKESAVEIWVGTYRRVSKQTLTDMVLGFLTDPDL